MSGHFICLKFMRSAQSCSDNEILKVKVIMSLVCLNPTGLTKLSHIHLLYTDWDLMFEGF